MPLNGHGMALQNLVSQDRRWQKWESDVLSMGIAMLVTVTGGMKPLAKWQHLWGNLWGMLAQ